MSIAVSFVLPTYNGEQYIKKAIESILAQTFRDFELLIINDGSTDTTSAIVKSYQAKDRRIRQIEQANHGLVYSLNRGIQLAKGRYIARHDDDDSSHPERLEKQVTFLQAHPEVVLVGSSMNVMDDRGKILHQHAVLLADPEIRQELLVRSPFAHGSVLFRREAAVHAGLYDPVFWPAEDYEFWLRLSTEGELANLDEFLYTYRENSAGISATKQLEQTERTQAVQKLAWQQRKHFLTKRSVDLTRYGRLTMGGMRIDRILSNISYCNRKALLTNDYAFVLKNSRLIITSPTMYRKLAGRMKAKVKRF